VYHRFKGEVPGERKPVIRDGDDDDDNSTTVGLVKRPDSFHTLLYTYS
jgi:hypothetical protein